MDAVQELKKTLERYSTIGPGNIRDFLHAENTRISEIGVTVGDSARLPAENYLRSPDLGARFLLGQLRDIFVSDLRGELLIVTMGVWMAETVKLTEAYDEALAKLLQNSEAREKIAAARG